MKKGKQNDEDSDGRIHTLPHTGVVGPGGVLWNLSHQAVGAEVPGYPGHANRAKKISTDPHGRNPDGHRHRGNYPRTTAVHHIWLESSACKRPLYRVLRRSAGRLTFFDFCYLHEG